MVGWLKRQWRRLRGGSPLHRKDAYLYAGQRGVDEPVTMGELMLKAHRYRSLLLKQRDVSRVEVGLMGNTLVLTVYAR